MEIKVGIETNESQLNPLSSSSFQPPEMNSHMGLDMWFWAAEHCLKTGEGSA